MEVILGLAAFLLFLLWLLRPSARIRELGDKIPGPKAIPIFGNALNFHVVGTKAFDDLMNARKKFGRTYRIWLGPQLHVLLSHPDDIQKLLSSQTLITKSQVYDVFSNWLGSGLLVSTGELWQRRRKAITPTFHFKVLDDFVPVFNKCANTLVSCLRERSGKGTFDISPYISNCALDAVSESAMGIQIDAQTKPKSSYVLSLVEMTKSLGKKINYPWLGLEPLYTLTGRRFLEQRELKVLHSLPGESAGDISREELLPQLVTLTEEYVKDSDRGKQVLNEKKASLNGKKKEISEDEFGVKKRKGFLELLLEIQKDDSLIFRTDQDVMDEVTTFMFEGHDTTTAALSFTIWLLGRHQDVQECVYKEVSSVLDDNPNPRIEDLHEMRYLERVIKESLRLYPPVPMIGRMLSEDTAFPSGYTIPAGAQVYASIGLIHRDPEYFPQPEEFQPDRFLAEQCHPYVYVPFSAGPRNCIGQKFAMLDLKSILAQLVYNYRITSDGPAAMNQEIILRVSGGLLVSLDKRKP